MEKKLQINLKGFTKNVQTRLETLSGIEYIVAPVTMIVEGVLPGSGGPIMYTANEIADSASYWDNIPVTVNHPTDANGNNVSARIPSVIEEFGVGQIYNTTFDSTTNSLKAEAWLNKTILEENFPNVYAAILDDNTNMEISTGVFFDDRGEPGDFDGISYNSTAHALHGDHLALLPNDIGACSWVDGCGLRANKTASKKQLRPVVNEVNFDNITRALRRYVDSLDDNEYIYYVDAVYSGYFTFEREENQRNSNGRRIFTQRTLWKQTYSTTNDIISPTGEPERVTETRVYTPVSEYADPSSEILALINKETETAPITTTNEESEMADDKKACCPEKVKSLIAAKTNSFTQADEAMLLSLDDKQLESFEAMNVSAFAANSKTDETETGGEVLESPKEFLKTAPDHIKAHFNGLLDKEEAEKQEVISNILKDENCTFTKEDLEKFEVNVLVKMSGLVKKQPDTNADEDTNATTDMSANGSAENKVKVPGAEDGTLSGDDALQVPVANWKKE